MTDVLTAPATVEPVRERPSPRAVAEHVAGLGAPALALSYLVHGTGGRDLRPLYVTLVATALAAVVLRVWRESRAVLVLVAWLVGAAFLVAAVHVPGDQDPLGHIYRWRAPGGYAVAALDLLVCRAYLTDRRRAGALALVVAAATCLQFAWAFTPWWGGGDPMGTMIGTIYWHNQYAAFLYPGAVIGCAVALDDARPWRSLGWVATALGTAGVVYSTSRATLALLAVSLVVVAGHALVQRGRRTATLRALGLVVVSVGVVLAMCNPPIVRQSRSPFAAEQSRTTAGESLATNGGYRLDFWHQAVTVARHHPVDGAGYGELARAAHADGDDAPLGAASPLAHNGFLQPFADGGLVLGVPFLVGVALLAWQALRRLPQRLRSPSAVGFATAVALGGLLAHSLVDFDWSYPALLVLGAVVAALASATVGPEKAEKVADHGRPTI